MNGFSAGKQSVKSKHVLVALGWYDHRLLEGIAAYATEHQWHLAAHSIIHEKVIPWGWEGDGVLAWLAAGDDLAHFVASLKKPTVDFSMRRPQLPFGRVIQDHAQTGRMVAEHFLERGIRSFCFYSDSENWSQVERGTGFVEALKAHGCGCDWLRWSESLHGGFGYSEWMRRREWLLSHLNAAPKPLGLFAANGVLAVEAQEVCAGSEIQVPDQVSIVGIEDYLLSVGARSRSITGVDTNLVEQGYQGAALLDRMMAGENLVPPPLRIAPAGVITRKSSDVLAVNHEGVAKALRFISNRFTEAIRVQDVAKVAGMSARGLHQAFCESIGVSPGQKIRTARMSEAKRLLSETEEKIEGVAERSGFSNLNTFFVAFRKAEGLTPAEFRKTARRGR